MYFPDTIQIGRRILASLFELTNESFAQQVTYAEPELVTGLSSQPIPMGSLLNPSGDSGMGSGGLPNSRYLGGGPGPSSNSSHYSSSLLNSSQPSNKFNTIHSSVNKGGNLFPMNHYETAGVPSGLGTRLGQKDHTYGRLGGGSGLPPLPSIRDSPLSSSSGPQQPPPPAPTSYHMSTLGRSSSMRAKDPLLSGSNSSNSAPNSNSSTEHHMTRQPQVVDSAYGTTRSSKKVYL